MFTTYPTNYQSLFDELNYSYTATSERDITMMMINSADYATIGVKSFYSTTTATANIAPIIRGYAEPQPNTTSPSTMDFVESQGHITVTLYSDLFEASPERIYTYSRSDETELGVLTTLPTTARPISLDESELLTLRVNPTESTTITIRQYAYGLIDAVATRTYTSTAQSSGVVVFNVVATALEEQLNVLLETNLVRFEVEISQPSQAIATLYYTVVTPPQQITRLAWISSRGSIEHYSFPVVRTRSHTADRVTNLALSSAFESYAVRRALAEIIESPKVWLCEDGVYSEVSVVSQSLVLADRLTLATIDLEVEY